MAVSLTHTTVATGTNAGNGEIAKEQWNENHTLTMATARLLGRTTAGTGAVEEISAGTGLTLSGGSLSVTSNTYADASHTHTSSDVTDFTEAAQDAAASLFTSATHTGITFTYNDAGGTLTAEVTSSGGETVIIQTNTTDFKDSVAVATTANISLTGEQTIDGVLTSSSRVLVKNQSTASQNGIYVSAAGAWSRATDADEDAEVTSGLLVLCEGGDTQSNTLFTLSTTGAITVGTTALTFDSIVLPSNPEILKSVTAATYTLLTTDPNKWLKMDRATAQTITVPANSTKIPVNSVIFIQQYGAGAVTLSPANGTVNIRAPQGLSTNTQYAVMRLKKIATNEWTVQITGNVAAVANGGTGVATLTGIVKGNGTSAFSAATAGTDYLAPGTSSNLTVGFTASGYNAGTQSSGTFTPNPANGGLQYAVNGGAHTLAPPSTGSGNAVNVVVQYTNNASAGAITTSGFTKVTGDAFTTTNGHDFMCYMTVLNGFSHLNVVALQ